MIGTCIDISLMLTKLVQIERKQIAIKSIVCHEHLLGLVGLHGFTLCNATMQNTDSPKLSLGHIPTKMMTEQKQKPQTIEFCSANLQMILRHKSPKYS